jgi:predicted Rossmann-fold nucleotide-binding protein
MGGAVSSAVLDHHGEITAVVPRIWQNESDIIKEGPSVILEIVDTIDQRKVRMQELGGAFVDLPGGLGTFEEARYLLLLHLDC